MQMMTCVVLSAAALCACVGDNTATPDASADATTDALLDAPMVDAADASKRCVLGTSLVGNCTLGP
jgi:hypothetical protein